MGLQVLGSNLKIKPQESIFPDCHQVESLLVSYHLTLFGDVKNKVFEKSCFLFIMV